MPKRGAEVETGVCLVWPKEVVRVCQAPHVWEQPAGYCWQVRRPLNPLLFFTQGRRFACSCARLVSKAVSLGLTVIASVLSTCCLAGKSCWRRSMRSQRFSNDCSTRARQRPRRARRPPHPSKASCSRQSGAVAKLTAPGPVMSRQRWCRLWRSRRLDWALRRSARVLYHKRVPSCAA